MIDEIVSKYSGKWRIHRLLFIGDAHSIQLAIDEFFAIECKDTFLFNRLFKQSQHSGFDFRKYVADNFKVTNMNSFVAKLENEATEIKLKLEQDVRLAKTNLIKEAIRVFSPPLHWL